MTAARRKPEKRALLTPDEVMNIREDELLVTMPQRSAACLTQRRYYADPEVKRRAPAKGQYWVPPLGPERADGPLEPPLFEDELDDEEEVTQPRDKELDHDSFDVTSIGDEGAAAALPTAAMEHDADDLMPHDGMKGAI